MLTIKLTSATRTSMRLLLVSKSPSNYILGNKFYFQTCKSSADVQYWTNIGQMLKLSLSQQPDHLGGWFWCQNYHLITYLGRNVNFRNACHQLMSNIGQILDKCWKLSIISATRPGSWFWCWNDCIIKYLGRYFNFRYVRHQLMSNIGQILNKCWKFEQ